MTRSYQKGHARKVLRVDMLLPFSVEADDDFDGVRESIPVYTINRLTTLRENSLRIF
jgi:hypothetical protein